MSLLLALQGGAPAITGTVVQAATKGQHLAQGVESFLAAGVQRGRSAPTVAEGVEGVEGAVVQVGGVGQTVAVGGGAYTPYTHPKGSGFTPSLPPVWVDPPYAPLAITGAGAGTASAGRAKSVGQVRNPTPKSPVIRAPFPPIEVPEVKQVAWRSWGDLGTQQDDEEAVLLALLD